MKALFITILLSSSLFARSTEVKASDSSLMKRYKSSTNSVIDSQLSNRQIKIADILIDGSMSAGMRNIVEIGATSNENEILADYGTVICKFTYTFKRNSSIQVAPSIYHVNIGTLSCPGERNAYLRHVSHVKTNKSCRPTGAYGTQLNPDFWARFNPDTKYIKKEACLENYSGEVLDSKYSFFDEKFIR